MSLIKKPSELSVKNAMSALIYGQPGTGKTTLACSAPDPVLFDFDGGVNRIAANHKCPTVQITCWEDALGALDEVLAAPEYKTIVIDTIGKMMLYIEAYIARTMNTGTTYVRADGSLTLKGYGVRKKMFSDFNNRLRLAGRHVIYVAHETEKVQKSGGEELTIKRPEISTASLSDLMKELDLVGYLQAYGTVRKITFDPQETFYAKNSCGIYGVVAIPVLFDADGRCVAENVFMQQVIKSYHNRLAEGQKQTIAFEQLKDDILKKVAEVETAEDANNFLGWVKGLEHIFNSKQIAWEALTTRTKERGITYNKASESFEDATK